MYFFIHKTTIIMYLSVLQLIVVSISSFVVGGILGYRLQSKKINSLTKEVRIKDASIKGLWSAQEKKMKQRSANSKFGTSPSAESNPKHVSDNYQATR